MVCGWPTTLALSRIQKSAKVQALLNWREVSFAANVTSIPAGNTDMFPWPWQPNKTEPSLMSMYFIPANEWLALSGRNPSQRAPVLTMRKGVPSGLWNPLL